MQFFKFDPPFLCFYRVMRWFVVIVVVVGHGCVHGLEKVGAAAALGHGRCAGPLSHGVGGAGGALGRRLGLVGGCGAMMAVAGASARRARAEQYN